MARNPAAPTHPRTGAPPRRRATDRRTGAPGPRRAAEGGSPAGAAGRAGAPLRAASPPSDARPAVGASHFEVLQALKRRGPATIVELGAALRFAKETLREHLEALVFRGLVTRAAARRGRPGRPEILYALAPAAEAYFPRRESAVLTDLVRHLLVEGREAELRAFFTARAAERREAARARLEGLRGRRRLEEVARILTEDGYMAEAESDPAGRPRRLRLCHCPIRDVVAVTPLPCGAELRYVRELLGRESRLVRVSYLPDGDASCSYSLGGGSETAGGRRRGRTAR